MIYCNRFAYNPSMRTLDISDENAEPAKFDKIQVAFIQIEEEDQEKEVEAARKLIKNLKWICGKNESGKKIILHSFAHLSESKAPPEFTREFFNQIDERLTNSGFEVHQTPFGYFLDLVLDAPGFSLARVFKSI